MNGSRLRRVAIPFATLALVCSLAAAEFGLRAAEQRRLASTVTPVAVVDPSADNLRVLCLGDSFTTAEGLPRDRTYPAHLERLLKEAGHRAQVFNQGATDLNSRQLLDALPAYLAAYQPDVVLLLVGEANSINPAGYTFDGDVPPAGVGGGSRLLRLFRGESRRVAINLPSAAGEPTAFEEASAYYASLEQIIEADPYDAVKDVWNLHNRGHQDGAMELCSHILQGAPHHQELLAAMGYFHLARGEEALAEAYYLDAVEHHTTARFVHVHAAYFYRRTGRAHAREGRAAEAAEALSKAVAHDPQDRSLYVEMMRALRGQPAQADGIAARLRGLQREHPELAIHPLITRHLRLLDCYDEWDERVASWLTADLGEIVHQCRREDAALVLMDYPTDRPTADRVIHDIAQAEGVPLVGVRAALDAAPPAERLMEGNHCTAAGNERMAREAFTVMEALDLPK